MVLASISHSTVFKISECFSFSHKDWSRTKLKRRVGPFPGFTNYHFSMKFLSWYWLTLTLLKVVLDLWKKFRAFPVASVAGAFSVWPFFSPWQAAKAKEASSQGLNRALQGLSVFRFYRISHSCPPWLHAFVSFLCCLTRNKEWWRECFDCEFELPGITI